MYLVIHTDTHTHTHIYIYINLAVNAALFRLPKPWSENSQGQEIMQIIKLATMSAQTNIRPY